MKHVLPIVLGAGALWWLSRSNAAQPQQQQSMNPIQGLMNQMGLATSMATRAPRQIMTMEQISVPRQIAYSMQTPVAGSSLPISAPSVSIAGAAKVSYTEDKSKSVDCGKQPVLSSYNSYPAYLSDVDGYNKCRRDNGLPTIKPERLPSGNQQQQQPGGVVDVTTSGNGGKDVKILLPEPIGQQEIGTPGKQKQPDGNCDCGCSNSCSTSCDTFGGSVVSRYRSCGVTANFGEARTDLLNSSQCRVTSKFTAQTKRRFA